MAAAEPEVRVSAFRDGLGGSLYCQKATSSPQVAQGLLIVCMGEESSAISQPLCWKCSYPEITVVRSPKSYKEVLVDEA
ncbi:Granzyme B [Manis pentadactyla]|nr:Granzyme B [Manis pentadactyla]